MGTNFEKRYKVIDSLQSICIKEILVNDSIKLKVPELLSEELQKIKEKIKEESLDLNYNFNLDYIPNDDDKREVKNEIKLVLKHLYYGVSIKEEVKSKYLVLKDDYPVFQKVNSSNLNNGEINSIVFGKVNYIKKPLEYLILVLDKSKAFCEKCNLPHLGYHIGCKFCKKLEICKCTKFGTENESFYKYDLIDYFTIGDNFSFDEILNDLECKEYFDYLNMFEFYDDEKQFLY